MLNRFEGKVVVITGSSRGLGFELAQRFADEGASVVVMGRNLEAAQKAAASLSTSTSMALRCDVSSESETLAMAKSVMESYGKVDVLVNNAGIFPVKLFENMTLEDWHAVMKIDLDGTFLATHALYPYMQKQRSGKIVNIASIAGRLGGFGMSHYSAAKAGVIGFTKALARECARMNIQVNAVAPGIVETDTALGTFPEASLADQRRQTPMGRLAKVSDLYGAVAFLASPESDFMTGQVIAPDGGLTMQG